MILNMNNKLTAIAIAFFISMVAMAQTVMTDAQILEYLTTESQKGTSQQKMAAELVRRGVTPAQLQRVRQKALQSKNELKKATQQVATAENRTAEIGMNQEEIESGDATEVIDMTEEEQRSVFGRNIFNSKNLTFQPASNIATSANHVIGTGDMVTINIWGASQLSIEAEVSADGYVVVEGIGPIKLAGLRVTEANKVLTGKLGQYYNDCSIQLSLTEARSIQVQVMGEVQTPGTYTLSSLSTAFNALYSAGGISKIGTLRDIKVYRSGRLISTIDVYDYILNGNSRGDVRLEDNDVILVGAYDCLVQIKGNVKRPMWYEMKKSETVGDLIRYAGSYSGNAYTKKVRVTRKSDDEYSVHTVDEFQMGAFALADEDMVEVDSIRARFSNRVEVRGAAKHPGFYELGKDINSVRTLLLAAEGLSENVYEGRAIMHRENPDLTLQMLSVDVHGIIAGTANDIPLKNNDVLFIPNKTDMMGERMVDVKGEVVYPGEYPFADSTTIQDIVLQTGGITQAGSLARIDVYRRIRDNVSPITSPTTTEAFRFSLNEDFSIHQDTTFYLQPYDIVVVRKSPSYEEQRNVTVKGEVNFVGEYSLTHKNYRLSELIKACGGLTDMANIHGASLTRKMTEEEIKNRNLANIKAQIQLYEDGLKQGNDMNMQLADSLLSLKSTTDSTIAVAIDLEKAIANPGSNDDIVLREGDVLNVPEHSNVIRISGEVMQPVSIPYEEGRSLAYYIKNAGGYSNMASKKKVYGINTNGSVVKFGCRSARDIKPGMEIVVPQKANKRKLTTETMGIISGIASLGAIITAIVNATTK